MTRVGDPERLRAAGALRRHYVEGRLTEDEFAERVELALAARTRTDLRAPFADLPRRPSLEELGFPVVRAGALARRAAVVAMAVGAWIMLSFALLVAFAVVLVVSGASAVALIAFPLAWVVLTVVLFKAAAGGRRRPHRY